jgi:hypothetical protein
MSNTETVRSDDESAARPQATEPQTSLETTSEGLSQAEARRSTGSSSAGTSSE